MNYLVEVKEVIDILNRYNEANILYKGKPILGITSMIKAIMNLSPSEQEQKIGKWFMYGSGTAGCSRCGTIFFDVYSDDNYFNFCPNCGAKMEEIGVRV